MDIHFLGTGAADWDWSQPLDENNRGSCCTLINGHILIDAGVSTWQSLEKFAINPAEITDLFITHSHGDHFQPEVIKKIAQAQGRKNKLKLYASSEALQLTADAIEKISLTYGQEVTVADLQVRALPTNHYVADFEEKTFNFLFDSPQNKRLWYALDGAWVSRTAYQMMDDKKIDMIIWDATSGTTIHNYRFASHNDLLMIEYMKKALENTNYIDQNCIHIFNHISKELWPKSAEERQNAAEKYQGILAYDGMKITL